MTEKLTNNDSPLLQFLVQTPEGRTKVISYQNRTPPSYYGLLYRSLFDDDDDIRVGGFAKHLSGKNCMDGAAADKMKSLLLRNAYFVYQGKAVEKSWFENIFSAKNGHETNSNNNDSSSGGGGGGFPLFLLRLRLRVLGGMDRQNRVGSKFGGGGQSSYQNAERERKERLKKLALESIDLAKDPYLVRNHLGTYECKLCLTLHRDEANYLAHTQGKRHQQGLARRAHMDKLKKEREGTSALPVVDSSSKPAPIQTKVKIGRPAYQVFKSRDADTNQRCLSFELQYPEIERDIQPRHRFMSAFEQRVESPPDRRYQYLLFAAEPYQTVAFKVPNEPIDKGENRFVTNWDSEAKRFTVTLYFMEPTEKN